MESTTPGLIAQSKARPTTPRYHYDTIFIDHYSRFIFVYLMETITSDKTVQAKYAFQAYSRSLGVHILHYHADNGRFADNAFIQHCQQQKQSLSCCGSMSTLVIRPYGCMAVWPYGRMASATPLTSPTP
mmetsp:Transcript_27052/g.38342  ORF Transcript_27052/g.38342 Transcript_27052/m.38342 type:complete len:129 (-) Transcript_27052:332-718(-)